MQSGDLIVLCTDGVWGAIEDRDFADFAAQETDLAAYNHGLLDEALRRGSDDNLSLLTLRFQSLAGNPQPPASASALASFFSRVFRR